MKRAQRDAPTKKAAPAWSNEPEPGHNRGDDLPADDTQLPSVGINPKVTHKGKAMMRVLKPLQDKATTGEGKRLVLPEPRRIRFLIRGEGPVSAGAVTIECCPESTKAGKFWMELATIPVPADNGLAQYYTEEASGLFRARISRPVSNGTVTVTPLVSRGPPDRPDRTKVV